MSKHAKPAPKHRGAPKHAHLKETPRKAARNTLVFSSVALAVTGASVAAGVAGQGAAAPAASADLDRTVALGDGASASSAVTAAAAAHRDDVVSRSDRRPEADPAKAASLSETRTAALTDERRLSDSDPKDIARALLGEFGFSSDQFGCLDSLWTKESGWRVTADNASSSAYGIPQALPGSKMATAGPDWESNAETQIRWGLGYIRSRYGSPCGAWGHSQSHNWY